MVVGSCGQGEAAPGGCYQSADCASDHPVCGT
jgi:hypothetical protein